MCRWWTRVAVASDGGGVRLFAVGRDQATPVALEAGVWSLPSVSAASEVAIWDGGPDAVNALPSPDRVVPKALDGPEPGGGHLQAVLPPLSRDRIRLS
jgi:hypothetical protein